MFEDEGMGEIIEATPASESEQQIDTTQEVDVNVDNTQTEPQGDTQDSVQVEKTVPLSTVETMRQEMNAIKEERDRILNLVLEGKHLPQQQVQPAAEPDPFAGLDPDTYLTAGQVMELWDKKQAQINARQAEEQAAYASKWTAVNDAEELFKQFNPDYDEVVNVLTKPEKVKIFETYSDPDEMILHAYIKAKMQLARNGKSAPSTPNTVKAKVDLENKLHQNQDKPKSVSQLKGTSSGIDQYDEIFNKVMSGN